MKKNGFVTSALLYGILSLFLVLILGTVAIVGNRKIANDKIKQSALDDVQNLTTDDSCFEFDSSTNTITKYHIEKEECPKTVFIPEKIDGITVENIGSKAFENNSLINVTIKSNIKSVSSDSFNGNDKVLFIIKDSSILEEESSSNLWGATHVAVRID